MDIRKRFRDEGEIGELDNFSTSFTARSGPTPGALLPRGRMSTIRNIRIGMTARGNVEWTYYLL